MIQRVNMSGGGSPQILFHLNLKSASSQSSRWHAIATFFFCSPLATLYLTHVAALTVFRSTKIVLTLLDWILRKTRIKDNCFREHHVSVSCEVYPDTGTVELCCRKLTNLKLEVGAQRMMKICVFKNHFKCVSGVQEGPGRHCCAQGWPSHAWPCWARHRWDLKVFWENSQSCPARSWEVRTVGKVGWQRGPFLPQGCHQGQGLNYLFNPIYDTYQNPFFSRVPRKTQQSSMRWTTTGWWAVCALRRTPTLSGPGSLRYLLM